MSEITPSGYSQPAIGSGPAPERTGPLAARDVIETRFGGTGDQGIILMGVLLAMAATRDHRYVAQTQTYGLGVLEGYGHSDVIISDHPVDYPELESVDLLVALCQEAADGYADLLRPDSILIYESDDVIIPPEFGGMTFGIPLWSLSREVTKESETLSEALVLGAVAGITGVVSAASLRGAVLSTLGAGVGDINNKTLERGLSLDQMEWRKDDECS